MIFSGLFRKTKFPVPDFSALGADMHSHLIPGIDDGAATLGDSLSLIRSLREFGYRKLVTTPHIMSDAYRNTPGTILPGLEKLRAAIKAESIDMEIEAAAEYYHDDAFTSLIGSGELLSFGDRYVLFEISYVNPPGNIRDTVFRLLSLGYKPILAHPERYPFWWNNFGEYENLKDAGVLLQVNLNSLSGYYSPGARKTAEQLIDAGMIEFAGTDLHGTRHLEGLARCGQMKYFKKLVESGKLRNPYL